MDKALAMRGSKRPLRLCWIMTGNIFFALLCPRDMVGSASVHPELGRIPRLIHDQGGEAGQHCRAGGDSRDRASCSRAQHCDATRQDEKHYQGRVRREEVVPGVR